MFGLEVGTQIALRRRVIDSLPLPFVLSDAIRVFGLVIIGSLTDILFTFRFADMVQNQPFLKGLSFLSNILIVPVHPESVSVIITIDCICCRGGVLPLHGEPGRVQGEDVHHTDQAAQ